MKGNEENINGKKSVESLSRRKIVQGVTAVAGYSALGLSGAQNATAKSPRKYVGVSYDTRTHITQKEAQASLNYNANGELKGSLKIAGYNIPIGAYEMEEPASATGMWSYWIEKTEKKFQEQDQKLQIRLNFDGDHIVGWITRPSPEFARLSFSMNAVDNGATSGKIEQALNPKNIDKFDKNPEIPAKGVPTATSMKNMLMKPELSANVKENRGDN